MCGSSEPSGCDRRHCNTIVAKSHARSQNASQARRVWREVDSEFASRISAATNHRLACLRCDLREAHILQYSRYAFSDGCDGQDVYPHPATLRTRRRRRLQTVKKDPVFCPLPKRPTASRTCGTKCAAIFIAEQKNRVG